MGFCCILFSLPAQLSGKWEQLWGHLVREFWGARPLPRDSCPWGWAGSGTVTGTFLVSFHLESQIWSKLALGSKTPAWNSDPSQLLLQGWELLCASGRPRPHGARHGDWGFKSLFLQIPDHVESGTRIEALNLCFPKFQTWWSQAQDYSRNKGFKSLFSQIPDSMELDMRLQ